MELARVRNVVELLIVVPLLALLFMTVPWARDRSALTDEEKLSLALTATPLWLWPWEEKERAELLQKVDPNLRILGEPLLVVAGVRPSNEQLVAALIERGADVSASEWGCSVLLSAISESGSMEIVKLLLAAGANANGIPKSGDGARSARKCSGFSPTVQKQIESGKVTPLGLVLGLAGEDIGLQRKQRGSLSTQQLTTLANSLIEHGAKLSVDEARQRLQK
jgi:hypothetical protein